MKIDPPYNTGKDFVYPDNFKDSLENYKALTGQTDEAGRNLSSNPETSGRYHTDWLNMIYPRLRLARNLLRDDGVIFISIDDNEVENLKKVCNEVFGEDNFVACVIWERAFAPKNDAKYVSNSHDYVLIYAKSIDEFTIGKLERSDEANARYKNLDNDPRGVWISDNLTVRTYCAEYDYEIITPSGRGVKPTDGRCWFTNKIRMQELIDDNRIWFGEEGNNTPRLKRFLTEVQAGMVPISIWNYKEVGHNQEGRQELKKLFEDKGYFDSPKPVRLLRRILTLANTANDSIILDFFSGSATTAHAVMELNADEEVCGHRQFIMVQLPEPTDETSEAAKAGFHTICEIGKERIRRAGEKIKEEKGLLAQNLDVGFKVFKLDSSNIRKWQPRAENLEQSLLDQIENLVPERTEVDAVYEIMLKFGLDLTWPVAELTIATKKVYSIGLGALIICMDNEITSAVALGIIDHLKSIKPETTRVVFRDNGFKTDSNKTNIKEILKCGGVEEFITI